MLKRLKNSVFKNIAKLARWPTANQPFNAPTFDANERKTKENRRLSFVKRKKIKKRKKMAQTKEITK
jgi:hypothetical protein